MPRDYFHEGWLEPVTIYDERMLEKLGRTRPLLRIFGEAFRDKVGKSRTPFLSNAWWLETHNVENSLTLVRSKVGRLPIGQLVGEDSHRPDVHLAVVRVLTLDELWCAPADRANAR